MKLMSNSLDAFRDNLRDVMESRGISLTDIADALKMSRPALSRVMNGHSGVTLDRAEKIADYVGVPLHKLLRLPTKVS